MAEPNQPNSLLKMFGQTEPVRRFGRPLTYGHLCLCNLFRYSPYNIVVVVSPPFLIHINIFLNIRSKNIPEMVAAIYRNFQPTYFIAFEGASVAKKPILFVLLDCVKSLWKDFRSLKNLILRPEVSGHKGKYFWIIQILLWNLWYNNWNRLKVFDFAFSGLKVFALIFLNILSVRLSILRSILESRLFPKWYRVKIL